MRGLALEGLTLRRHGAVPLFAPVTLHVAPGEVAVLMGPSGAGKSTLLAHVAGVLEPGWQAAGTVMLDGRALDGTPAETRRVGLMFQDAVLFPHLSVGGNLAYGLAGRVRGRAARAAAVAAALAEAGLEGFAGRAVGTLSGGQAARVALLRTLLAEPRALLLDEPFSRLDAGLRDEVRRFVFARAQAAGLPVLLVTHDAADAAAAGALAGGRVVRLAPDGADGAAARK